MIQFACTCGNQLEVPSELAGTSLQCPECGLLTDVPTLAELESFTTEGTYRVDASGPVATDDSRLSDLGIIYAKTKFDEFGNEIDLRSLPGGRPVGPDAFYDDETGEIELAPAASSKPDIADRPKYDPETGELIRPIEFVNPPDPVVDPASIPMAKPAIQYAGSDVVKRVNPINALVELLMPGNVVVMCVLLVAHLFNGIIFIATMGLFFLVPALLIYQCLLLSHYGNVIDEIGRNDHDDLPRPLRNLEFHDDMWAPFVAMFAPLLIAYVIPLTILVTIANRAGLPFWPMWLIGGIFGTFLCPALMLTTNTSGSSLNLRPDRVLRVIKACGFHYLLVTLLWAVTLPIYAVGWLGLCGTMLKAFDGSNTRETNPLMQWMIVLPALLAGIYLMHYFCWYLGLLYRAHHPEFPWVLQRYVKDPMDKRPRPTHADQLGRRRAIGGHLAVPPVTPPRPPSSPPPSASRVG